MTSQSVNLGDGLVLHSLRNAGDMAGFIALNEAFTGEGRICECLLQHHPGTSKENYICVEDMKREEIISSACLIPWQLNYDGVFLNAAMLEMIVTHPDYRHRGLIRTQINHLHQKVKDENIDLCIIQGIPYYYRQFGYAYVLNHMPFDILPSQQIPQTTAQQSFPYNLHPATIDDAAALTDTYHTEMQQHAICVQRDERYWRYLLQYKRYPVRVLQDIRSGQIVGYICLEKSTAQHITITESAVENDEQGLALLHLIKAQTAGDIRIVGTERTRLVSAARYFGSQQESSGQWLVRIASFSELLTKIGPVLERRLSNSDQASLSCELIINLYREAFSLKFAGGKLVRIDSLGFVDTSMGADGGDLWIPPDAFTRFLFGYRSLDELMDAWPDIYIKAQSQHVWDALFPRMDSLILMPY